PELMASLDGFQDGMFVEIKYTNKKFHEMAQKGEIPPMHVPQMIHNSIVLRHVTYATGLYVSCFEEENGTKDIEIITFVPDIDQLNIQMLKTFEFHEMLITF